MSSTIAAAPALPAGGYERAPAAPPSFHHALVVRFGQFPPDLTGPIAPPDRVQLLYREPLDLPAHRGRYYHPRMYAITVEDVMDAVDRLDVRLA